MTAKVRTLAEAAAEILAQSKKTAPAEATKKIEAEIVDLGGSTTENPDGGKVGAAAAAAVVGTATPPGTPPAADSKEPMKEDAAEVLNKSKEDAVSEPAPKMDAGVVDLGGSTNDNPDGGNVGAAAAAAVGTATPPGTPPAADSKEPMEKEGEKPAGEPVAPSGPKGAATETMTEEEVSEELTEEEVAAAREAKLAMMKEKMAAMGVKEDIEAIFGQEGLSEEFKTRVSTIFETAVITRAVQVVEEMEQEILMAAEEAIEENKAELEEQVDAYLNYVVEEWKEENKVGIEAGLRSELLEDFMLGLKNLFTEHYIDIPEDKVSVVDALADEVEALKKSLEESNGSLAALQEKLDEAKKTAVVKSVCEGLTATQAEKVKTLAEGVKFTTEGEYNEQVKVIRESYFPTVKVKQESKNPVALVESENPVSATVETPANMQTYINALSRTMPR